MPKVTVQSLAAVLLSAAQF